MARMQPLHQQLPFFGLFRVLLGFTLIATLATILGNLLADVGYAVLDPRVRYN